MERRSNRAPWLALLLALAVIGLNFGMVFGLPGQGMIAWLTLLLGICAALVGLLGIARAFGPQRAGGKISSSLLGVFSLLICGLGIFIWVHSRDLPASSGAPHVGQKAPDFTLSDSSGNKVSLAQLLAPAQSIDPAGNAGAPNSAGANSNPKAVLLIFYRGYW
ncbi:MAG TPA: hypothetical protein VJW20_23195 [Candidatus Angelobacter sp.]|nr:hypothetical protein [Candidatus Angelobacter sp.]